MDDRRFERKNGWLCILLVLAVLSTVVFHLALSGSGRARNGYTITLRNMPDVFAYGTLQENCFKQNPYHYDEDLSEKINGMIRTVYDYDEEGWQSFGSIMYISPEQKAFLDGASVLSYQISTSSAALKEIGKGKWTYSDYVDCGKPFCVVIVSGDGDIRVSNEIRRSGDWICEYNYRNNRLSEKNGKGLIRGILALVSSVILIVAIKGVVIVMCRLDNRENVKTILRMLCIGWIPFYMLFLFICYHFLVPMIFAFLVLIPCIILCSIISSIYGSKRLQNVYGEVQTLKNVIYEILTNVITYICLFVFGSLNF